MHHRRLEKLLQEATGIRRGWVYPVAITGVFTTADKLARRRGSRMLNIIHLYY